ncbi:MAG TPA: YgjP-like metallopeptidase domain-containing protein [Nitrososphaerales archaeon]|nr:YgjP-like metallopeptidase domain-containing protein [Nitrososphaerales archaeon]
MPSLYLGAKRIDYAVVKGTSRSYTYFRFRPDLTLEVILPRGRLVDVEKALRDRSVWLQREYEKLSNIRDVLGDNTVMFDGKLLRVVFSLSPGDSLVPDLGRGEVVVYTSERKRLRELVRRWFLRESSAYVVRKVAEMAPKLGVRPSRVDVREMGKWGYCTRGRRLSFSWQLIALPEKLREYVVLHELTHLREFNHSSAFKRKLAVFCPDFRERERELNLVTPYNGLEPPG